MLAKLTIREGEGKGKAFKLLDTGPIHLGRSSKVEIKMKDSQISRRHVQLEWRGDAWHVMDLGSSNGTFVNDERVTTSQLNDGDRVRVGETTFEFRHMEGGQPAVAAQPLPLPETQSAPVLEPEPTPLSAQEAEAMLAERPPEEPGEASREGETAEPTRCSECGKSVPSGSVGKGQAEMVGNRLFCRKCAEQMVLSADDAPPAKEEAASADDSSGELFALLGKAEQAAPQPAEAAGGAGSDSDSLLALLEAADSEQGAAPAGRPSSPDDPTEEQTGDGLFALLTEDSDPDVPTLDLAEGQGGGGGDDDDDDGGLLSLLKKE